MVACRAPQERLQLLGRPRFLLHLRDRSQSWRVGDEGDVAWDESVADGVG